MHRGPWGPKRGFKEKGKAEPDPGNLLGDEWAAGAVGKGEELFWLMDGSGR